MIRKAIATIILLIIAIGIFIFYIRHEPMNVTYNINTASDTDASYEVVLVNKYDLPEELLEVSGIVYLEKDMFAAVQDEKGIVFIYKTDNESIEKQVKFGNDGDYEDLAIVGDDAYVLKSDGTLYEVQGALNETITVSTFTIPTGKADFEGMCYDEKNNRLLIARKDNDKEWSNYKYIYSFSLSSKEFEEEPVYRIDLNNEIFEKSKGGDTFNPSAIAINPVTEEIYILEGKDPKLLILAENGDLLTEISLNNDVFLQPEGISFSEKGNIFISNEGSDSKPGNILELQISKK